MLDHCARAGDRLAIVDGVETNEAADVERQRLALSSTDGALYHPWLWVPGHDDEPRHVPPCGHVAGVYSRCDQLVGAHQAPANEPIEGVLDLRVNHTAAEVGALFRRRGQLHPGAARPWGPGVGGPDDERRPELAAGQRPAGLPGPQALDANGSSPTSCTSPTTYGCGSGSCAS